MTDLLTIENLGLTIAGQDILRGVSLAVGEGEALGIVGESGSGKSMTIKSVVMAPPRGATLTGSIRFRGRDITALSGSSLRAYRQADVGMVFQDPHSSLNPVRRIGDFLTETSARLSREQRREQRERATRMLGDVGISSPETVIRRYPHQLSGGMLQRVVIASVLLREPSLILADEPTTALDVTTQSDVIALLDEQRRKHGASLIFISHDIELVAATCDRIAVMYQGRIIENLSTAQLHAGDIAEPYTEALLECRPSIDHRVDRMPVIDPESWGERYA